MKKQFLLFGLLIALFSACKKESFNATKQSVIDDEKIQAYLAANHITATKTSTGLYYKILIADTGAHPTATDTVQVNYSGSLLNGTIFSPESIGILDLPSTVAGFQQGIPLIANGGRIMIFVPSALGYGTAVDGNIPANSVLIFTVDLLGYY